jgi:hypothetical protein
MRIELESVEPRHRSADPVVCFVCERRFVAESALAALRADTGMVCGDVCPRCLAAGPMGRARPERFPDLEEFARRLDEWRGPVFASDREIWEENG